MIRGGCRPNSLERSVFSTGGANGTGKLGKGIAHRCARLQDPLVPIPDDFLIALNLQMTF